MDDHHIRVVCTDEGRHRIRPLATIVVSGDGGVHLDTIPKGDTITRRWSSPQQSQPTRVHGVWTIPDTPASEAADSASPVWRFDCPSCWRTTEISDDRWADAWTRVAAAGLEQVDISRLNF